MFRKLQDRFAAAASIALGLGTHPTDNDAVEESNVQSLQALGFTANQATIALQASNGNVDRAAETLLQNHSMPQQQPNDIDSNTIVDLTGEESDVELQRALQQSLEDDGRNVSRLATTFTTLHHQQQHQPRTAAANKAAEAAVRRAAAFNSNSANKKKSTAQSKPTTLPISSSSSSAPAVPLRTKSEILRHHHPNVKLVPKLQDKSLEEQVIRTVDRMKHHPAAIDTLHRALTTMYQNPHNTKYRRIQTQTVGYQRSVAGTPGVNDFLRAMKFFPANRGGGNNNNNDTSVLILSESMYDPALIYLGITALEQTRLTPEYVTAKEQLVFVKDMKAILEATVTVEEATQRAWCLSQCPAEPPPGRGALLQVHLLDGYTIRRRFDSDDTVADVLQWMGGTAGTAIVRRLVDDRTWCLVDINHSQRAVLDTTTNDGSSSGGVPTELCNM